MNIKSKNGDFDWQQILETDCMQNLYLILNAVSSYIRAGTGTCTWIQPGSTGICFSIPHPKG